MAGVPQMQEQFAAVASTAAHSHLRRRANVKPPTAIVT
jgi:hypothetical protein